MKRVANSAVEVAVSMEAAADMEEWIEMEPASTRTSKEGKFLHRMLDQLDKEDEEKRIEKSSKGKGQDGSKERAA